MYCPNCGKELQEGAKFCLECGAKIGVSDTTASQSSSETEKPVYTGNAPSEKISAQSAPDSDTNSTGNTQNNPVAAPPKGKKGKKVLFILLLILIPLIIYGVFSDSAGSSEKRSSDVVSGRYSLVDDGLEGTVKIASDYDENHYKISYSGNNVFGIPGNTIEITDQWFIFEKTVNGEKWFHVPQEDMDDYYWVLSEDGSTLSYGYYEFTKN